MGLPDFKTRCAGLELELWAIDFLELGVWNSVDYATSFEDALMLASSLANTYGDERVRLVNPDGSYL